MNEEKDKNIIVIQDGNNGPKNGLTWGRYGHFIAHYRWWIIGFTLGGGLLAYLLTQFALTPRKEMLNVTVNYDIALTKAEDGTYHYLDGTPFSFLSIVSDDTLQNAIDQDHKNLDLSKIKANSALTIAPATDSSGKEIPLTYNITGKAAYLGGVNEGTKLIEHLISSVQKEAYNIASQYQANDYLSILSDTSEFEAIVKASNAQYAVIDDLYQSALSVFNGTISVNGDTLSNHYGKFLASYLESETNVFTSLLNELKRNRYVNYQDGEESKWIGYYTRVGKNEIQNLKDIQAKIDVLQARLDDLKSAGSAPTNDSVGEEIVTISRSLQNYESQKNYLESDLEVLGYTLNPISKEYELNANDSTINGKIQHLTNPANGNWRSSCQEFAKTLTTYKADLQSDTDTAESTYRDLYTNYKNRVYYPSTGVVVSGGYNAWLGGFVGLAVGFLASSLICSAVGVSKLHHEEEKKKAEEAK